MMRLAASANPENPCTLLQCVVGQVLLLSLRLLLVRVCDSGSRYKPSDVEFSDGGAVLPVQTYLLLEAQHLEVVQ